MPWTTSSTLRRSPPLAAAVSRSCRSDSRSAPSASARARRLLAAVEARRRPRVGVRELEAGPARSSSASRVGPAEPTASTARSLQRLDPLEPSRRLSTAALVDLLRFAMPRDHRTARRVVRLGDAHWLAARSTVHVFRVWAPRASGVELVLPRRPGSETTERAADARGGRRRASTCPRPGTAPTTPSASTAAHPLPDPRSAWQPHGVHGPSRVFDPSALRLGRRRLARAADVLGARVLRAARRHLHPAGHPGRRRRAARPPGRPRASTWSS